MNASTSIAGATKNDPFFGWFKARGGKVHSGVGITSFPSMGRGAIALEDIKVSIYNSVTLIDNVDMLLSERYRALHTSPILNTFYAHVVTSIKVRRM